MESDRKTLVVLRNGFQMPIIGFGCWMLPNTEAAATAVETALEIGYRHLDTAYAYQNEEQIGKAINNWLLKPTSKREDLFIVTKLPGNGMTDGGVNKFLDLSLKKLNLDYVDLYLIHFPVGIKGNEDPDDLFPQVNGEVDLDYTTNLITVWKEMEAVVDLGLTKSIGVSNFDLRQLEMIHKIARIPPVTNQIEMNVYYQRRTHIDYCKKNGMVVTASAPLGSPGRPLNIMRKKELPKLLQDPVVALVAQNHKVTTAQILIKFLTVMGAVAIPKSINVCRIKTNYDIFDFELTAAEIAALQSLDKGKSGKSFTFRKYLNGNRQHPEFPSDD